MKPKTVMLLAVAVGCGLVAMLGVQQAINARPKAVEVEKTRVLVALENIDPGFPLTPEMVEFRLLPKAGLPADAVTSEEQYAERSLNFPIAADDVIRTSKLSEPGVSGRSLTIPPGHRVVGISVDDTQTQTGMLKPGDLVDVFVTYDTRPANGPAMTQVKTLLCDRQSNRQSGIGGSGIKDEGRFAARRSRTGHLPHACPAQGKTDPGLAQSRR
jgi:pilus assembly protein CpaB